MTEFFTRYVVTGSINGARLWLSEHTDSDGDRWFQVKEASHGPNAALFLREADAQAALDRIPHGVAKKMHIIPIQIQCP